MIVHIYVDEDSRVVGYGDVAFEGSVEMEFEEDAAFLSDPMAYRIVSGELVHDDAFVAQAQAEAEARNNKVPIEQEVDALKSVSSALLGGEQTEDELLVAMTLNKALQKFAATLPEQDALELAAMYPAWEPNKQYKAGEYVRHGLNQDGEPQVFSVIQAHTSQSDWVPGTATASIFKKLGFTPAGTPIWVQPLGAHDAYQMNDEVSHNGVIYKSTANNNVWAPGVFGWIVKGGNR